MRILIILMLAAAPAGASGEEAAAVSVSMPDGVGVGSFEEDADTVYAKLRRLMLDSRKERFNWQLNHALDQRDPAGAQAAMDALLKEFPESKAEEPNSLKYHQGGICFWRGDFDGAWREFDSAAKALERKYPEGIPPGPYAKLNATFMSSIYFSRGAAELHRKRYAPAAADMEKAIAAAPEPRAYMHINKCWALLSMGKYREAALSYDRAYAIDAKFLAASEKDYPVCPQITAHGAQARLCRAGN